MASRKQWAKQIGESWQKSVESIIETGDLLIQAKEDLVHGEWQAMIETDLPFEASTARKLKIIAENPIIGKRAHVHVLPASWGTLYELTKLDNELGEGTLQKKIDNGDINSKTERKDVVKLLRTKSKKMPPDLDTVVTRECALYQNIENDRIRCLDEIIKHQADADADKIEDLALALQSYAEELLKRFQKLSGGKKVAKRLNKAGSIGTSYRETH